MKDVYKRQCVECFVGHVVLLGYLVVIASTGDALLNEPYKDFGVHEGDTIPFGIVKAGEDYVCVYKMCIRDRQSCGCIFFKLAFPDGEGGPLRGG